MWNIQNIFDVLIFKLEVCIHIRISRIVPWVITRSQNIFIIAFDVLIFKLAVCFHIRISRIITWIITRMYNIFIIHFDVLFGKYLSQWRNVIISWQHSRMNHGFNWLVAFFNFIHAMMWNMIIQIKRYTIRTQIRMSQYAKLGTRIGPFNMNKCRMIILLKCTKRFIDMTHIHHSVMPKNKILQFVSV